MATKTFTQAQLNASDLNTYALKGDTCIASVPVTYGTINNCFSSTYENYKIVVSSFNATGDCFLWMQLGYGGGSSWLGGLYYQAGSYHAYSTGTLSAFTNNAAAPYFYICGGSTSAVFTNSAVINISRPYTSSPTEYSCAGTYHVSGGIYAVQHGGKQNSTQYCDSIRWATTASAVASGTVSVYGMAQT
jgi:hypothetical protein